MDVKLPVNPEILKGISQVDHFRGVWAGSPSVPTDRLDQLKRSARAQSVVSSCRIAGVRAEDDEIAAIINASPRPLNGSSELAGYALAIDRPFPSSGPLITLDEIAKLNAILLGKPGDPPPPSPLRDKPLHQEIFDAEGRALGRVLQTLPPRLLRDKAESAVSWLELELRAGEQHPLLVIGGFFVYFTAISPFERANGRAARVMMPHLMRRCGYGFIDYASLEGLFEERRFEYYDAIDQAETKIWTDEADLAPWLGFFVGALNALTARLQQKLDVEVRSRELPPLQRAILATIREHGTGAASLLIASTGANRNTLKDNLRRLVERGLLERVGTKRGTFYRLPAIESPVASAPAAED
jgi:Fic family protein